MAGLAGSPMAPPSLGEQWAQSRGYDRILAFLRESMPTEAGTEWVWGLPAHSDEELHAGIQFISGGWPRAVGAEAGTSAPEVAIPEEVARSLGKSVGGTFWIGYARWPFGLWNDAPARISGIFRADSPLLDAILADETWLAGFTHLSGENALLAWGHPVAAPPQGTSVMYSAGGRGGVVNLPSMRERLCRSGS